MSNILIGCPIYKREWVLPLWLEGIEQQTFPKSNLGFIFELAPDDDGTHQMLWEWQMKHPEFLVFDGLIRNDIHHNHHPEGQRIWNSTKYLEMVDMRNSLLERATSLQDKFDYYFSLDSDLILENPETLQILSDYGDQGYDILSPLSFMTPTERNYPSVMSWVEGLPGRAQRDLPRYPLEGDQIFQSDVVMAAVFMSRKVFTTVRYRWHRQGEDLGFATALYEHGIKSYCIPYLYCPHLMHEFMVENYKKDHFDPRKN